MSLITVGGSGLRGKIMQGGAHLIFRQGIGLIIGLFGMLLLARMIGPDNYGTYVTAFNILIYAISIAGFGINVYLIRHEGDLKNNAYHLAFTILLLSTCVTAAVGISIAPMLSIWLGNAQLKMPLIILFLTLPLNSVILPLISSIEKNLNYRAVAIVELVSQAVYYGTALSLASNQMGVFSPVIGYCCQQFIMAAGVTYYSNRRLKIYWSIPELKVMVLYGFGYSSSVWIWQLRNLVNPIIVGRLVGAEAVGYVAISIRIVDSLSFMKTAVWRISLVAFAKVQNDMSRLRNAFNESMLIQLLAVGIFLVGFSIVSPYLIPIVFGAKWVPAIQIFPYVAIGFLTNCVFNMHSSVLYVYKKNWDVSIFHITHVVLFISGSAFLVNLYGYVGYGLAEFMTILSYVVIHRKLIKIIAPTYKIVFPLYLSMVSAVAASLVSLPWSLLMLVPFGILCLTPSLRSPIVKYARTLGRKKFYGSTAG